MPNPILPATGSYRVEGRETFSVRYRPLLSDLLFSELNRSTTTTVPTTPSPRPPTPIKTSSTVLPHDTR